MANISLSTFGLAVYPPGAEFGPRLLRDFEFVWILEGDALYFRDEKTIDAPAATLILCKPDARDGFRWDAQKRTRHAFFHFQIQDLNDNWPPLEAWPDARKIDDSTVFAPLFRHILARRKVGDTLQTELAATLLLRAFVTGETSIGDLPAAPLPDAVERALQFIFEHLERDPIAPLSLELLARSAFVTPEHLCRIFKSATGKSPLETVRLARLDRAAILLARSNYAIFEVAHLCGFHSPFHFSRAFKVAYGVSPRALRASLAAGEAMPLPRLLRNSIKT